MVQLLTVLMRNAMRRSTLPAASTDTVDCTLHPADTSAVLTSTLFLFLPALTAFSAVTLLVGWQEGYSASSSDVINTWDVLLVGWQERHPACSSDVSKTQGALLMQNRSCKHGARFHWTTTSTHVLTSTEMWLVQTEHATFAHMLLLFFNPGTQFPGN